jgi:pentatricopeptide repeat protein
MQRYRTFNFVIAKRLGEAFALIDEMASKGLMPNPRTYSLFFRLYYLAYDIGNAWRLYERVQSEGCFPNTQSCMFIIRLCHRHGKVAQALKLWGDMIRNGFASFTLVSDVLFDLLCDEGKLEEAKRCFHQMIDLGQKPSNVAFRRIKILMQLTKQEDSIVRLTEKIAQFGGSAPQDCQRVHRSAETRLSFFFLKKKKMGGGSPPT